MPCPEGSTKENLPLHLLVPDGSLPFGNMEGAVPGSLEGQRQAVASSLASTFIDTMHV